MKRLPPAGSRRLLIPFRRAPTVVRSARTCSTSVEDTNNAAPSADRSDRRQAPHCFKDSPAPPHCAHASLCAPLRGLRAFMRCSLFSIGTYLTAHDCVSASCMPPAIASAGCTPSAPPRPHLQASIRFAADCFYILRNGSFADSTLPPRNTAGVFSGFR